jgi:hypothetical protein
MMPPLIVAAAALTGALDMGAARGNQFRRFLLVAYPYRDVIRRQQMAMSRGEIFEA